MRKFFMSDPFKEDKHWIELALEAARQSDQDIPVGACLVEGGKLIATAHNLKEALHDPTAHAEIVVIRQACQERNNWRLNGTVLYTTLEPCPMCAEAILQCRVGKVVFGAYDALSGALGSAFNLYKTKRIYPAPEVLGGIMEEECAKLLKDFFRNRPKSSG